jgi:hypothetical protein
LAFPHTCFILSSKELRKGKRYLKLLSTFFFCSRRIVTSTLIRVSLFRGWEFYGSDILAEAGNITSRKNQEFTSRATTENREIGV